MFSKKSFKRDVRRRRQRFETLESRRLLAVIADFDFSDNQGNPDAEGFTTSGSANEWHLSTGRGADVGHSSDDSFYFGSGESTGGGGEYGSGADGTLTSPSIDLTNASSALLSFNHLLDVETGYDFATISVVNSQGTTVIATSGTELPVNTNGFAAETLNLTPFVGEAIQLQFRVTSDSSIQYEGWYLDDIKVTNISFDRFVDPNPTPGNGFGSEVVALPNGNVVITAPYDDAGAPDAGAVYLFNGQSGELISTLTGSTAHDRVGEYGVTALENGNFVVLSPEWDNSAGAVTFGNATTGVSGAVSDQNSLVGTTAFDFVGAYGVTALEGGNYVVRSPDWNNGAATDAGAVTFGNGTNGVSGAVSDQNSLVGTTADDRVGSNGVTALEGGHYVVRSLSWDNGTATDAGAVTFGSGINGVSGAVSDQNSLVGTTADDEVGNGGVTALEGGHYVVSSPDWDNGTASNAGAVTFGSGVTGVSGAVSDQNSLVGTTADDRVGRSGVVALDGGNYVVSSSLWDNGTVTNAGAVTFGNGSTGVSGAVSDQNSLVGTSANDFVGLDGVTALEGGNYVVHSPFWDNGVVTDAGAATFGNATTGVSGAVSDQNSLVGTSANDFVSLEGVTALEGGNYVVRSPVWDNGTVTDAGAATFGNATTGVSGIVSDQNSLVGTTADDYLGLDGVTALEGGNYVVRSSLWDNGVVTDAGAATFGNATTGVSGAVSDQNSLVGTSAGDYVGLHGVTALEGGNYVVRSSLWDNGAVTDAGAVTFGNATTGVSGAISNQNSLVGTSADDVVGIDGVVSLEGGSYVVRSSSWDNGVVAGAGAVTYGNATTGVSGAVSDQNSLVGTSANDFVGNADVTALKGGNYVVRSSSWDNGAATDAGAVTFGDADSGGAIGPVSAANSLIGSGTFVTIDPFADRFFVSGESDVFIGSNANGFAASIHVTTNVDEFDFHNDDVSLREAIFAANLFEGTNRITFDDALAGDTISLTMGELSIEDGVEIVAPSRESITIDAGGNSRVIGVETGSHDVLLSGLVITGGLTTGYGGGVEFLSSGTLTVEDGLVSANSADFHGGGIFSRGDVLVRDSTIDGNQASIEGGGIRIEVPTQTVKVISSTLSDNSASFGGGISADNIDLSNSTVSNNTASSQGGGLFSANGSLTLTNSTVFGNLAAGSGGGLRSTSTVQLVHGTIIAGNTSTNTQRNDIAGNLELASSFNLIGDGTGLTGITNGVNGNQVGTSLTPIDPGLGPLQDNGGPILTHALAIDSPARNAGDPTAAFNANEFDQRGEPFGRVSNNRVDIGAFELQQFTVTQVADELDLSDTSLATYDGNDLSLREAITLANLIPGSAMIDFDVIGAGSSEINVTKPLPAITSPVVIDGTSQPGYVDSPLIGINGANAGNAADGLSLQSTESTVKGLAIYGFTQDGIDLNGGGTHAITKNYIGLDLTGAVAGNRTGLKVTNSAGNKIDGNVISGNNGSGVIVSGESSTGNELINNRIGTDAAGNVARPNSGIGAFLKSPDNVVGKPGAGNVISGNGTIGLTLSIGANGTTVQGNKVGTNAAGDATLGNLSYGILVQAADVTIGGDSALGQGNQLSGNGRHGVILIGAAGGQVNGNLIGTNYDGTSDLGNAFYGVYALNADNLTVGTLASGHGNVISGNDRSGVMLVNTSDSNVQGNIVGANVSGSAAIANAAAGVGTIAGSSHNVISNNQVSGNGSIGVFIDSSTSQNNHVHSNLVGTNADGTAPMHNGSFAIFVRSPSNTIGGTPPQGNIVSSTSRGIVLSGVTATDNTVSGNSIGTNAEGTVDFGMATGIQLAFGAHTNILGPDNLIANNETGVRLLGNSGSQNKITQNSFTGNSVVGIDLAGTGPTANDAGDADEGPNRGQNHPELQGIAISGNNLNVTFNVPTDISNATYDLTIELFKSDVSCNGVTYLGSAAYTVGNASVGTVTRAFVGAASGGVVQPGDLITATATDAAGNTSEFSATIQIPAAASISSPSAGARSSFDVNADGLISAVDALMVINSLDRTKGEGESPSLHLGDVNGDKQVSALDALQVINYLSEQSNYDPAREASQFSSLVDQVLEYELEDLQLVAGLLF